MKKLKTELNFISSNIFLQKVLVYVVVTSSIMLL